MVGGAGAVGGERRRRDRRPRWRGGSGGTGFGGFGGSGGAGGAVARRRCRSVTVIVDTIWPPSAVWPASGGTAADLIAGAIDLAGPGGRGGTGGAGGVGAAGFGGLRAARPARAGPATGGRAALVAPRCGVGTGATQRRCGRHGSSQRRRGRRHGPTALGRPPAVRRGIRRRGRDEHRHGERPAAAYSSGTAARATPATRTRQVWTRARATTGDTGDTGGMAVAAAVGAARLRQSGATAMSTRPRATPVWQRNVASHVVVGATRLVRRCSPRRGLRRTAIAAGCAGVGGAATGGAGGAAVLAVPRSAVRGTGACARRWRCCRRH